MSVGELPQGWAKSTLDAVADWGSGGTPSRKNDEYYGGDIPWIKTGDLGEKIIRQASEYITEEAVKNSSAKYFQKGSVILAMYGATIGRTSILGIDATTNQACAVGQPNQSTTTEFLYYLICNEKDNFIAKGKGGAQPNISQALIKEHEINLPPLAEQQQIAAKLDVLLAQVDSLKTRLDAIPKILKRFRQSVLDAAVSGGLTKDWRSKNDISTWEEAVWGDILHPSKGSFKRGPFGSSLTKSMFVSEGYKVYEQYCPINDDCSYERYYIDENKFNEMQGFEVLEGDFLISCSGVSLGRITQVPKGSKRGIINQALLRVRLDHSKYNSEFFKILFKSPSFQKVIFENSTGSAIPNLKGVKELKSIIIPSISLDEQAEIISRVEELFAYADQIEQRVKDAQSRVNLLTQSILAKAFRGELTAEWREQNPDLISGENSAEALLARIRAEREASGKVTKRSRKVV